MYSSTLHHILTKCVHCLKCTPRLLLLHGSQYQLLWVRPSMSMHARGPRACMGDEVDRRRLNWTPAGLSALRGALHACLASQRVTGCIHAAGRVSPPSLCLLSLPVACRARKEARHAKLGLCLVSCCKFWTLISVLTGVLDAVFGY